jgi:uncharacterized membrane protein (GlpM family)
MDSDNTTVFFGLVMIACFFVMIGLVAWFITGGMYTRAALTMLVWVIGQLAFLMSTDQEF